jgi:small GTP-binding protein
VIFLGDSCVGKTSILQRFQHNEFCAEHSSTVGASFFTKRVETERGAVHLNLWDTAGHERYRCLVPMYSRGCAAAIVVFDVTDPATFTRLSNWIEQVRQQSREATIIIAANKIDLTPAVDSREVKDWARKTGFNCFFVSAVTGSGIGELFEGVAAAVTERKLSLVVDRTELEPNQKGKNCCAIS